MESIRRAPASPGAPAAGRSTMNAAGWAEELSCVTPLRANPVRRPDDTSERRAVPCGLGHVRENWAQNLPAVRQTAEHRWFPKWPAGQVLQRRLPNSSASRTAPDSTDNRSSVTRSLRRPTNERRRPPAETAEWSVQLATVSVQSHPLDRSP